MRDHTSSQSRTISRTGGSARRKPFTVAAAAAAGSIVVTGCSTDATAGPVEGIDAARPALTTTLHDADGMRIGTATLTAMTGGAVVTVTAHSLAAGYHGLHIHTIGLCEPDSPSPTDPTIIGDFLSAGGHLAHDDQTHGEHAGDLPSLYVGQDGRGTVTFATDAFTPAELLDADGSAVMVHEGRDNYANIPDRYAPDGPDLDTLKTGDSGPRIACAALSR